MTTALQTKEIRSVLKGSNWHKDFLRYTPTKDLLDRLEAWQYTRLESIDHQGGREFCELQIDDIRAELTRRRKYLARAQAADGYAPKWPNQADREARFQQRIEAVKYTWPIDRFCEQVMFCDLKPVGRGEAIAHCPFPDHDDGSPSFRVYSNNSAWCFGCQRGGDVFSLAETYFQLNKFIDVLKTLEDLSPVGRVA